jgi:PKD repeat protein
VTSDTANISDFQCGYVTLDRTPPGVTAGASATTVKVGDLVNFSGSATDATSGVPGPYSWNFGDNTAGATGSNVSHTYTTAGTFIAKVTTTDGAGNTGEGTKTITVTAATTSGGGGSVPGGTSSGGTLTPPPTTKEISGMAGGGGTSTTTIGALDIVAPKRFTITGKRQKLPLVLSPDTAGKVNLALVSPVRSAGTAAAKIVAKASANFTEPGSYGLNMKLPRKLKAGTYQLKVTFKAAGATKAVTKTLKVKFVKKRARGSSAGPGGTSRRPNVTGGPGYGVKPKRTRTIPIR